MTDFYIMKIELWSGFFGTLIGAIIGGYIAYLIARLQIKRQEKQFHLKEERDKEDKEIQLLWKIYFDIKNDCENSKLWEKYEVLLQKRQEVWGTPTAEYVEETLQYIMRDLSNFFKILYGKENEIKDKTYNEFDLLWERAGQLLILMFNLYDKLHKFYRRNTMIENYYKISNEFYQKHNKVVQKK